MYQDDILDKMDSEEIQLDSRAQSSIKESIGWIKLISITGFIFLGLGLLNILYSFMNFSQLGMGGNAGFLVLILAISLVMMGLFFYIYLLLYRYQEHANSALKTKSTTAYTDAVMYLSKFFKVIGVLFLIVIILYAVLILIAILGAIF